MKETHLKNGDSLQNKEEIDDYIEYCMELNRRYFIQRCYDITIDSQP
jgi:hypothetical protein